MRVQHVSTAVHSKFKTMNFNQYNHNHSLCNPWTCIWFLSVYSYIMRSKCRLWAAAKVRVLTSVHFISSWHQYISDKSAHVISYRQILTLLYAVKILHNTITRAFFLHTVKRHNVANPWVSSVLCECTFWLIPCMCHCLIVLHHTMTCLTHWPQGDLKKILEK